MVALVLQQQNYGYAKEFVNPKFQPCAIGLVQKKLTEPWLHETTVLGLGGDVYCHLH